MKEILIHHVKPNIWWISIMKNILILQCVFLRHVEASYLNKIKRIFMKHRSWIIVQIDTPTNQSMPISDQNICQSINNFNSLNPQKGYWIQGKSSNVYIDNGFVTFQFTQNNATLPIEIDDSLDIAYQLQQLAL